VYNSNSVFKKHAVFRYSTSNNAVTLKSGSEVTQGHSIDWYGFLLVFYRNFVPKTDIFDFKNVTTMKTGLWVRQGHWKCHHSIERIRLPINVYMMALSRVASEISNVENVVNRDLEIRVKGQSRSSEPIRIDQSPLTSY